MTTATSRILLVGLFIASLSACSTQSSSEKAIAVVLNLDLSEDALSVDGEVVSLSELSLLLKNETTRQATYASITIDGNVSMASVSDLMSNLRASDVLGIHYTSDNVKQKFYPVTL